MIAIARRRKTEFGLYHKEMQYFETRMVPVGGTYSFSRIGPREKLIVAQGKGVISVAGQKMPAAEKSGFELETKNGSFEVLETAEPFFLIRMCGRWGEKTGGSGIFEVRTSGHPQDGGDPVEYPKTTNFDCHYR